MKPYARKASVLWLGTRRCGKGALSTPSAALKMPLYAAGRDIKRRGTNPPELIAAAHAGSFSLTLGNQLGEAGYSPRQFLKGSNSTDLTDLHFHRMITVVVQQGDCITS